MVKKMRRVRTFARTASKSMEKNLINNAKKLKNDPFLVLPKYNDNYSKKTFKKINKGLEKVNNIKENIDKLEKLSNKKSLDGAVAGTILLAHAERAPYLAVARLPTGDVTYAQRGKAEKLKLIAAQHFDNPIFRLFGIRDIALKGNIYIYSWNDGFFSSGPIPKPPKEFISFIFNKIGFSNNDKILNCNHIIKNELKEKKVNETPYIRIYWKSADVIFGICKKCMEKSQNTIFNITKYIIGPELNNDFSIDLIAKFIEGKHVINNNDLKYLDDYLHGKISDLDLILKNISKREEIIKESGEKLFILDGKSYGSDIKSFIKALKPNKYENEGLEFILTNINKPVILKNVTSNKVLEIYWDDYGFQILNFILKNEELAKKFNKLDETPSDLLELVFSYKERENILSELPKYKSLPPLAKFADQISRLYKTYGKNKILTELKNQSDNTKSRSLAYAFLLVFEKGKDSKWKFSNIEIESGEFLKEFAKDLLDSKPNEYHNALKRLLNASGSSEKIDNYKIS